MQVLEPINPQRIRLMLDLVSALSSAQSPQEVLRAFAEGWNKLQEQSAYISLSCENLKPGAYRITRKLLTGSLRDTAQADPWSRKQDIPTQRGGLLGWIVEQGQPMVLLDPPDEPDEVLGDELHGFRSIMAIPLYYQGRPMHWAISLSENRDAFSGDMLEEAILRGNLIGNTVRQVRMAEELREAHGRIQKEIKQIANIQRTLLQQDLPRVPGLSMAARYETFDQAGGDLYHVEALSDDRPADAARWAFIVADVSGHGPASAVVMAMVYSILMTYPVEPSHPGEVLDYLNAHLCRKRIADTFVTATAGIFDARDHSYTYASAGHPPTLWRRRVAAQQTHDVVTLDRVGGLPLGVMDEETYEHTTIELEPGHTLALYTDGIPETRNPRGEFFGIDGIRRAIGDCSGEADCLVDTLHRHVRAHEAGRRPQDDQTVLALHLD